MGFTYVPARPRLGRWRSTNLSPVPVVAAALGPCAGLGAARVVAAHFSVIVRGTAQLFVAGPPVVAMAGDGRVARQGGARRRAGADARRRGRQRGRPTRTTRSRSSSGSSPTCPAASGRRRPSRRRPTPPTAARRSSLVDRPPRRRASPTRCAASSSWSSTAARCSSSGARFGRPLITALARLGGRPVGVLASDPKHYGGGLNADASDKLGALRRPLRPVPAARS